MQQISGMPYPPPQHMLMHIKAAAYLKHMFCMGIEGLPPYWPDLCWYLVSPPVMMERSCLYCMLLGSNSQAT